MKSILEELYNGNICPVEAILSRNPEYRPLNRKISEMTENWRKRLNKEEFKELENLMNLRSQSNEMHTTAAFMHGFKLGAAILVEVMAGKEELVRHES